MYVCMYDSWFRDESNMYMPLYINFRLDEDLKCMYVYV